MFEEFVRDNNITLTRYLIFALPLLLIVLMALSIRKKPAQIPPVEAAESEDLGTEYQIMPKIK